MPNSILTLIEKTRSIGTWTVDMAESVLTWSPTTYAIHEEDPSKPIRLEDGINYYVPEHRPIIEKCIADSITDEAPWDVELQIRTTRGHLRWVRAIGEPIFENGKLVRLQGVFEDINERKSLEVEREELLRRVLEGERIARLGHWSWHGSPDSLDWTPGTYRIHEVPEDQPPPTAQEYLAAIHPADRDRVRQVTEDAVAAGTNYSVDFRTSKNGTERYIRSEGFPQFDAKGRLVGFTGVAIERTDEVLAQLRNEELNRRLTLALEASQFGVWEWRVESNELIWDAQMYRLYGIDPNEFTGAYDAWANGLHPDDKERTEEQIQRAIETKTKFETTFRVAWPDGTVRTIQTIADSIYDASGKPERMIGVNWDTTELVRTQKELERSNEELAQFAYRTSHDLKSPLTAIRRLTSYMQQDLEEGAVDEVATSIEAIEQRAIAMEEMVAGILTTAKADLTTAHAEPIDLKAVMGEIAASLRFLMDDKRVDLSWTVIGDEQPVLARMRVYQILANLVGNGVKYSTPRIEPSFVRVESTSEGEKWLLTVEDNGTGMPSDDADMPYEMFARFDSETSGSGLGLYIVKKHVDSLGGTIRFSSSEAGTRFDLCFPLNSPSLTKVLA